MSVLEGYVGSSRIALKLDTFRQDQKKLENTNE